VKVRVVENVFDDDESHGTLSGDRFKKSKDIRNPLPIKASKWFVEEKDSSAGSNRSRDGNAFRLPEGNLVARRGLTPGKPKASEHFIGSPRDLCFLTQTLSSGEDGPERVFPRMARLRDGNVVAQSLGVEQTNVLPHPTDPFSRSGLWREVVEWVQFLPPAAGEAELTRTAVGEKPDGAGVRLQIAGQDVDERRFPRAIVATKQDYFALAEFEIHAIEHHLTAERFPQPTRVQND
jgi:hypothetical protein